MGDIFKKSIEKIIQLQNCTIFSYKLNTFSIFSSNEQTSKDKKILFSDTESLHEKNSSQ